MPESLFDPNFEPSDEQLQDLGARAVRRAMERGEERLRHWLADGTLVSGEGLATGWCVGIDAIEASRESGALFSVFVDGQHWYPSAFLQLDPADLKKIVHALRGKGAVTKTLFLMNEHGALHGKTPTQAVAFGMLGDVLRIAGET